jgi:hypothetical protein
MNTITQATAELVGMSESAVVRILGEDLQRLVREIDNEEMEYGTHWKWVHGRTFYLPAGLDVLVDQLNERGQRPAALALKTERDRLTEMQNKARFWWQKEEAS